jgi:NAD(P)-dependent dehydrogenase (short-subunit alcohol dehydrogenase family)
LARKNQSHDGGGVVVTGASTGIGKACALRLGQLGFTVFAGVRKRSDADSLSREGSNLHPVMLDVTKPDTIESAVEQVGSTLGDKPLWGLVNNAGIAVTAPLEFIPLDELRHQIEVNVIGQVAVTQALLSRLRASRGRIVNISSVGGRVALPFLGPYAGSKHALEGMSDSLRRELRGTGVEVSVVEPGSVKTPIWEKGVSAADSLLERMPAEAESVYGKGLDSVRAAAAREGARGVEPDQVADVVAHALTAAKPRTRYPVGRGIKMRIRLWKMLPDRAFDRLIARVLGLR